MARVPSVCLCLLGAGVVCYHAGLLSFYALARTAHISFMWISVGVHLGCLYSLLITSDAALKAALQASAQICVLISFRCIPRSRTASVVTQAFPGETQHTRMSPHPRQGI